MENKNTISVSSLGKTWIFDLDGTIVKHNGYKIDGQDSFLPGAEEFLRSISKDDMIIFVTSRTDNYIEQTKTFLRNNHIRYDALIHNAPYGERIIVNDKKPSGLKTSLAINTERDIFMNFSFVVDEKL